MARKDSIEGEIDKDPDRPKARQQPPKDIEPNDAGIVEVELPEPDDDDDGDDDGEQPVTRQEKKRQRASGHRELQERAERAEREAAAAREAAVLQYQQFQYLQQQGQQKQADPQEEVKKVFREQEDAYAAFKALEASGGLTDSMIQQYKDRFQDIEVRKQQAIWKASGMAQQQLTPQQVVMINQRQQLYSRYGDVLNHQQAGGWAYGTYQARVAAGEPDTEALRDEVAEEARRRFGLPSQIRRSAPTQGNRAKYTGMSAGANSSARADAGSRSGKMELTKDDVKMAVEMYKKRKDGSPMPQAEAVRLYAANLAKRRQQKSG